MNTLEAHRILSDLLSTTDDRTKPPSSVSIVFPEATREAIRLALDALARTQDSPKRELPAKAGVPWTKEEDDRLRRRFVSGATGSELAEEHQRTTGAIKARLIRLDLLNPDGLLPSVAVPESTPEEQTQARSSGAEETERDIPEAHSALIKKRGYDLQVKSTEVFHPSEIKVLRRYGFWLEALADGKVEPTTPEQERFVSVCRGEVKAESIYERAWMRLVGRREIEPELVREFVLSDPGEAWFKREAHWRYH